MTSKLDLPATLAAIAAIILALALLLRALASLIRAAEVFSPAKWRPAEERAAVVLDRVSGDLTKASTQLPGATLSVTAMATAPVGEAKS